MANGKLKNRIDLSHEEVTRRLESGQMQIHKFPLGFIITEIKDGGVLHVFWLGGERLSEWVGEAFDRLREFGIQHGCSAIEAHCRPGLARMLKAQGFRTKKITIRANL